MAIPRWLRNLYGRIINFLRNVVWWSRTGSESVGVSMPKADVFYKLTFGLYQDAHSINEDGSVNNTVLDVRGHERTPSIHVEVNQTPENGPKTEDDHRLSCLTDFTQLHSLPTQSVAQVVDNTVSQTLGQLKDGQRASPVMSNVATNDLAIKPVSEFMGGTLLHP